jgi:hypothetical protein
MIDVPEHSLLPKLEEDCWPLLKSNALTVTEAFALYQEVLWSKVSNLFDLDQLSMIQCVLA